MKREQNTRRSDGGDEATNMVYAVRFNEERNKQHKTGQFIECFHLTCPKTMKRWPCWCPKPILWGLNSFLMQTLSFVPINVYRCWQRKWKHSILNSQMRRNLNALRPRFHDLPEKISTISHSPNRLFPFVQSQVNKDWHFCLIGSFSLRCASTSFSRFVRQKLYNSAFA